MFDLPLIYSINQSTVPGLNLISPLPYAPAFALVLNKVKKITNRKFKINLFILTYYHQHPPCPAQAASPAAIASSNEAPEAKASKNAANPAVIAASEMPSLIAS